MSEYKLTHTWRGDTLADPYARTAVANAAGKTAIHVSADGGYGGDSHLWNPEDLLGASLSQCHTLTYLALLSKVGVGVTGIDTDVTVTLGKVDRFTQVTNIHLKARVTLAPGADPKTAEELYGKAHKYCFIANSLKAEITWEVTLLTPGAHGPLGGSHAQ